MLNAKRDVSAAKRFFRRVMRAHHRRLRLTIERRTNMAHIRRVLPLREHARPASPGAVQTRTAAATSAGASTLPAVLRRFEHHDVSLPAAYQTRDDVPDGESCSPGPLTPGTPLRRVSALCFALHSLRFSNPHRPRPFKRACRRPLSRTAAQRARFLHAHAAAHPAGHRPAATIFPDFGD